MKIGKREFVDGTHIMAILNLTPDSFFADSRVSASEVLRRAERLIDEGADVLDVGAQSTRPGHTAISAAEELARLKGPLRELRRRFDIPISVDTYSAQVAEVALSEGADLINDIWGLQYDREMADTVARHHAAVCIMHNQTGTAYADLWRDMEEFFRTSLSLAAQAGIDDDKILLDGGIGFGKTKEQNWEVLRHYERLKKLGYPLLLGTSRKSLFGGAAEDRLLLTLQSTKQAVKQGVLFVRVHDVKENLAAILEAYDELY